MKNLIPNDEFGDYLRYISDQYYYVVKDRDVVELGSMNGFHTLAIYQQHPKSITCVEPSPRTKSGRLELCNAELFNCTANDYYKLHCDRQVDVVTCMGLLYHLHSPLHLFELIANYSNPKYIIIETISNNTFSLRRELVQADGQAFPDSGIKNQLTYNLRIPDSSMIEVLSTLGYNLIKSEIFKDRFSSGLMKEIKNDFGIWLFERDDNFRFVVPTHPNDLSH